MVTSAPAPAAPGYRLISLIIAAALLMENLDATVLTTAIPVMAQDFQVRAPQMSFALTAYLLALALCIPASGYAADRWGAKPVFRAAIGVFTVSSLICALSPNLPALAIARFVQGVGGAMMVPIGRLVLLQTIAKRDLVAASSWFLMPGLLGQVLGPPIGGLITTYLNWRWIFWINLPIGIVGILLVTRFIPATRAEHVRPFDRAGFVLSGAALVTLLTGLDMAGHGGQLGRAMGLLAIGVVCAALYIVHASRRAHAILDLTLLRVPTFRLALIGGSLTRITHGAQTFLLPLMMQLTFGLKAAESGLITMATSIGTFTMKGLAAGILNRWGFRNSLLLIGALGASSYALCGFFRVGWPVPMIFAVLLTSGFLMSFQFTAYNTIAYDEIDRGRMSSASSFYSVFQQLTISLGVMCGATVLHGGMTLGGRIAPVARDFSLAFWVVSAISLCSFFANIRFAHGAGRELTAAAR